MKSIKPGRGPSFMGGIGSVAVAIFGVFWTIMAASMGAPIFFPIFGVVFIFLGIAQAVYQFKNATSKNRYSAFDITDSGEEDDPLNTYFGSNDNRNASDITQATSNEDGFCPYCGSKTASDHLFCKRCGKRTS